TRHVNASFARKGTSLTMIFKCLIGWRLSTLKIDGCAFVYPVRWSRAVILKRIRVSPKPLLEIWVPWRVHWRWTDRGGGLGGWWCSRGRRVPRVRWAFPATLFDRRGQNCGFDIGNWYTLF